MNLAVPDLIDRPVLSGAAAIWLGVVAPTWASVAVGALAGLTMAIIRSRRAVVSAVLVGLLAGSLSGVMVSHRQAALVAHGVEGGPVGFSGVALSDAIEGEYGITVVVDPVELQRGRLPDLPVAVRGWPDGEVAVGDLVRVTGTFKPSSFRIARRVVAGTVSATAVDVLGPPTELHLRIANALRSRIHRVVEPHRSDADALVTGFLIGDTDDLSPMALDSMRSAGLTHFVAVSGSNVALFLGLWWLILSPLGVRSWVRAGFGLAGLFVFAALTRWEPSVIRASVCAATLLVGRAAGLPLSTWTTLGLAVSGALLVAGELATDVGFQLSVLATMGVMAGSGAFTFRPGWLATGLGASVSAQVAVAPVLISAFGSLPLLSPLANVVAGPIVAVSTALGGVGALSGWRLPVDLATGAASLVLTVADVAAPWPQIGAMALVATLLAAVFCLRFARWALAPAVALVVVIAVWPSSGRPPDLPAAVFLDVGQGDATLLLADDATVLIDGGPDPVVLSRKLDRYGIDAIDLLVVTHVHADHIRGLEAVLGALPVGAVAYDFGGHATPASAWFEGEVGRMRIPRVDPRPGNRVSWTGLEIGFVGPLRAYDSPNDESVVLAADLGDLRVLMSGDIETYAQHEAEVADVDVLKVPHQGAATSDLTWLGRHAGSVSVISVGPNDFGHPSDDVIAALRGSGSDVRRTDLDGDVVISGGRLP